MTKNNVSITFERAARALYVGGLAILCIAHMVFGIFAWPLLDGDAITFIPPIINLASGEGLINGMWPEAVVYDLLGEGRLMWHGFLFQCVTAHLPAADSFYGVIVWLSCYSVVIILLWAYNWHKMVILWTGKIDARSYVAMIIALAGLSTSVVGLRGRPELFVMFLLGWIFFLLLTVNRGYHGAVFAGGIACVGATHPIAGMFLGLGFSAFAFAVRPASDAFRWIASVFVGMILCLACLGLLVYPYSLVDWVQACLFHARNALDDGATGNLSYWIFSPRASFYGIVYTAGVFCLICFLVRYRRSIQAKYCFYSAVVMVAAVSYYFSLRIGSKSYNLLAFSPLLFSLIVCFVVRVDPVSGKVWSGVLTYGLMFCLILSTIGFVRHCLVFPEFHLAGLQYVDAKRMIENVCQKAGKENVYVDRHLFSIVGDCENAVFGGRDDCDVYIVQQAFRSGAMPEIDGFRVKQSFFATNVPSLFGVKLANSVNGYNFAVFRRVVSNP